MDPTKEIEIEEVGVGIKNEQAVEPEVEVGYSEYAQDGLEDLDEFEQQAEEESCVPEGSSLSGSLCYTFVPRRLGFSESEEPDSVLLSLLKKYPDLHNDQNLLRELLATELEAAPLERNLFILAVGSGVVHRLALSGCSVARCRRLSLILMDNYGILEPLAYYAVLCWAKALGLDISEALGAFGSLVDLRCSRTADFGQLQEINHTLEAQVHRSERAERVSKEALKAAENEISWAKVAVGQAKAAACQAKAAASQAQIAASQSQIAVSLSKAETARVRQEGKAARILAEAEVSRALAEVLRVRAETAQAVQDEQASRALAEAEVARVKAETAIELQQARAAQKSAEAETERTRSEMLHVYAQLDNMRGAAQE